ncbi:hypothetical protein ABZ897_49645 [Nonomuraea sp. NPDC046802]|uniref:hypothetical protein n=1 Tax=Nonomuraea sp. NPDC046802 TaxID=3154919 RepID=UPI0033E6A0C7
MRSLRIAASLAAPALMLITSAAVPAQAAAVQDRPCFREIVTPASGHGEESWGCRHRRSPKATLVYKWKATRPVCVMLRAYTPRKVWNVMRECGRSGAFTVPWRASEPTKSRAGVTAGVLEQGKGAIVHWVSVLEK